MLTIKPRSRDVRDEELAATGIAAGMGHGESTGCVLLLVDFALDLVAGTAGTGAIGTTTLDHEIRDDAMKRQAVVKTFFREIDEIFDCIRCVLVEEFEFDGAFAGDHGCCGHDGDVS